MFFQVNQLIIYTSYSKPKTSLHNNIPNLVQERLTDKPHLFPKHCHVKSGVWLSSRPLGKGAINFCEIIDILMEKYWSSIIGTHAYNQQAKFYEKLFTNNINIINNVIVGGCGVYT